MDSSIGQLHRQVPCRAVIPKAGLGCQAGAGPTWGFRLDSSSSGDSGQHSHTREANTWSRDQRGEVGPHWGCYWYPRPPQPASKSLSPMAPSSLGSCWHCPVPAACTSSCQEGFAPGLELPLEQTGGLQGTQHSRGIPLVTAKPQPGLGSALCPADARWLGARQGSRAL